MKVQLKWKSENNDENLLQVTDRVFIGRTCPGAIESKRIIIQDKAVSRDHASVTFRLKVFLLWIPVVMVPKSIMCE